MAPFQTHAVRLLSSTSLSEFTKHLEFEMQNIPRFGFVPGQWLSLKHTKSDGEEITRAYSIASPPSQNSHFALCLNRVQDGFMSNFLCDMKEGGEIAGQGPFGDFILRPPMRDTIFIATGTGIAPNRTEKDIYYHQEFSQLARAHENFHYMPTLSRADQNWQGLQGYVQEHVPRLAAHRTDMHAYICGLDKMIKANRDLLKGLGWDRKDIRYEKYD
jgi:ferredoxin-NADP reductase